MDIRASFKNRLLLKAACNSITQPRGTGGKHRLPHSAGCSAMEDTNGDPHSSRQFPCESGKNPRRRVCIQPETCASSGNPRASSCCKLRVANGGGSWNPASAHFSIPVTIVHENCFPWSKNLHFDRRAHICYNRKIRAWVPLRQKPRSAAQALQTYPKSTGAKSGRYRNWLLPVTGIFRRRYGAWRLSTRTKNSGTRRCCQT